MKAILIAIYDTVFPKMRVSKPHVINNENTLRNIK